MPAKPSTSTIDLLEVSTRAKHARHIVAGFSRTIPAAAELWRQIDDALSDLPALIAEITRLHVQLTAGRLNRANLAAAGRATIAACINGESEPLTYLSDELDAQGFGTEAGQA